MGVAEGLCLGAEEGGSRVLLSYNRFGPSKIGFLSSQADYGDWQSQFCPRPRNYYISVLNHL